MPKTREDKPAWAAVPAAVRARTEQMLGARVTRAPRAFGGYGPSATFSLTLEDGRRAFFKGVYPLPEGSGVKWMLDEEERVYANLGDLIAPWAPRYFGSLRVDGWHAVLIESVAGERVPPWNASQTERAARSYAEFHANTKGSSLPEWLSREHHLEFVGMWRGILDDPEKLDRLVEVCADARHRGTARAWLMAHGDTLASAETGLVNASAADFALLHFDTRCDNIRLAGRTLRIFDWPFACVGPAEFDFAAFAQSIYGEGGPAPEESTSWYSDVLAVDENVLTASVVAIAGYFADRAPRPALAGLPRLRQVQRRQLTASLPWAARRLGLAEPSWLAQSPTD